MSFGHCPVLGGIIGIIGRGRILIVFFVIYFVIGAVRLTVDHNRNRGNSKMLLHLILWSGGLGVVSISLLLIF